jgi:hypothetical protein
MPKERKIAAELSRLVKDELAEPNVMVSVHPDPMMA